MYCVNCGVKLADTEKICPLCQTEVYHPTLKQKEAQPLYPTGRIPRPKANSKMFCGIILILYLIPILICLMADIQRDGHIRWFGFAAGAILLSYIIIALPLWFKKPNPVVFVPCDFIAVALYLWYINHALGGSWFFSFALPITLTLGIIICTVITLVYYLRRGLLYIFGGGLIALGLFIPMLELHLDITFGVDFIGWSNYPFIVLAVCGGALIYLGINSFAREMMERKLFF